jgi:hypothetical protein
MTDGTVPAIASKQADSTRISINKWSDFTSNFMSTQHHHAIGTILFHHYCQSFDITSSVIIINVFIGRSRRYSSIIIIVVSALLLNRPT